MNYQSSILVEILDLVPSAKTLFLPKRIPNGSEAVSLSSKGLLLCLL